MKYSIILLAYDPEGKLVEMTKRCIGAIIDNSIGEDYELLIHTEGGGYIPAINIAFQQARGEYIVFICNDVLIKDNQWLKKFAVPDKIASWNIGISYFTNLEEPNAACYCMPKSIQERIGLIDERFNGGYGFDDTDYFLRARELGIEWVNAGVRLEHEANVTFQTYFKDKKEMMTSENGAKFFQKWPQFLPR